MHDVSMVAIHLQGAGRSIMAAIGLAGWGEEQQGQISGVTPSVASAAAKGGD